jgi:hypothetical protein
MAKALNGAQNLRTSEEFIEKSGEVGPIYDYGHEHTIEVGGSQND